MGDFKKVVVLLLILKTSAKLVRRFTDRDSHFPNIAETKQPNKVTNNELQYELQGINSLEQILRTRITPPTITPPTITSPTRAPTLLLTSETSIKTGQQDNQNKVINSTLTAPFENELDNSVEIKTFDPNLTKISIRQRGRQENFEQTDINTSDNINKDDLTNMQVEILKTQTKVKKIIIPPSELKKEDTTMKEEENIIPKTQKVNPYLNNESKEKNIGNNTKLNDFRTEYISSSTSAPVVNQLEKIATTYKTISSKPVTSHITLKVFENFTSSSNETFPKTSHYEVIKNSTVEKTNGNWTTGSTLLLLTSLFSVATVILILLHRKGLLCSGYEDIFVRNVTSQSAYQHNDVSQAYGVL